MHYDEKKFIKNIVIYKFCKREHFVKYDFILLILSPFHGKFKIVQLREIPVGERRRFYEDNWNCP